MVEGEGGEVRASGCVGDEEESGQEVMDKGKEQV